MKSFQSMKSSSCMTLLSWWGSFHLSETPVSPAVPIDKGAARRSNVFSLHVLEDSVLLMLEEKEKLVGESSAGSCAAGGLRMEAVELIICVVLSGLCLLRWFHLPTSGRVAVLSLTNATRLPKWEKCSLFLCPAHKPKALSQAHLQSQKSAWIAAFRHGVMKTWIIIPQETRNMVKAGKGYMCFHVSHTKF